MLYIHKNRYLNYIRIGFKILHKVVLWLVFLKLKGECSALKSFRRMDFKMNGIDRPFCGRKANYNAFIAMFQKDIFNFLI